jgi:uncharacterized membrane protein
MKAISRTFLTGLVTVLPAVATFYVLFWLARSAESFLGGLLRLVLPHALYFPGLGVAAGVAVVFAVGLAMRTWVVRGLFAWAEGVVFRVPLVKSLYGAIRDFFGFISGRGQQGMRQVVAVPLGDSGMEMIGFVTRTDLGVRTAGSVEGDKVAVYLPMGYQIGGFTVLLSRSAVRPLDMSGEEAMRFVLTAGMTTGPQTPGRPQASRPAETP